MIVFTLTGINHKLLLLGGKLPGFLPLNNEEMRNRLSATALADKTHRPEEALKRMKTEGLINVSQAVTHGNLRRVRNLKTEKQGTVIEVDGNELTVHVGRATEVWPYEDCDEVTWQ